MDFFEGITTEAQLKLNYRRLALMHHPDKGGNIEIMKLINKEYNQIKKLFLLKKNPLFSLEIGDTVFVNGTECVVTVVSDSNFIARAKGRTRKALFDKNTGLGVYNQKYKAYVW
ncbi:MAG: hypothetical protein K8R41_11730 [Bacteroidales bacterium]|nr:hypothetical protein [Bacteroidales bacterium]